jgi:hypothetical protein
MPALSHDLLSVKGLNNKAGYQVIHNEDEDVSEVHVMHKIFEMFSKYYIYRLILIKYDLCAYNKSGETFFKFFHDTT